MRLSSKQHDYYDSLFSHSVGDKRDIFTRNSRELPTLDNVSIPQFEDLRSKKYEYQISFGLVGFCGKIYPYIHVNQKEITTRIVESVRKYIYDFESLKHHFPEIVNGSTGVVVRSPRMVRSLNNIDELKCWLEHGFPYRHNKEWGFVYNKYMLDLFRKEKCAYYHVRNHSLRQVRIEIYPILANLQFFRKFDVVQTFQEIVMFVGSVLAPKDNPYIAPVPDKIKAESHGFNKFSFRKDPTTKKRRK